MRGEHVEQYWSDPSRIKDSGIRLLTSMSVCRMAWFTDVCSCTLVCPYVCPSQSASPFARHSQLASL